MVFLPQGYAVAFSGIKLPQAVYVLILNIRLLDSVRVQLVLPVCDHHFCLGCRQINTNIQTHTCTHVHTQHTHASVPGSVCLLTICKYFTDSLDVYNILSTNSKSLISKLNVVDGDAIETVFKCYVHDFVLYFFKSSEESDITKVKYELQ